MLWYNNLGIGKLFSGELWGPSLILSAHMNCVSLWSVLSVHCSRVRTHWEHAVNTIAALRGNHTSHWPLSGRGHYQSVGNHLLQDTYLSFKGEHSQWVYSYWCLSHRVKGISSVSGKWPTECDMTCQPAAVSISHLRIGSILRNSFVRFFFFFFFAEGSVRRLVLFTFGINIRPGRSAHKWTALSTGVNTRRTHLRSEHSDHIQRWSWCLWPHSFSSRWNGLLSDWSKWRACCSLNLPVLAADVCEHTPVRWYHSVFTLPSHIAQF